MKQSFYLIFYNKVRNQTLALLLAQAAYLLYCLRYCLKKQLRKKTPVRMDPQEARETVMQIWPKPVTSTVIENRPVDPELELSIIIPVYNYEQVLEKMLRSVLNQNTQYRYEVILVDDGSREPAKEILRRYQQEDKVTVIFQQNQGISGARNTGIQAARGKYLMFVDCDDTIHRDMVQTMLQKAHETHADIVMCAHALVKEKDGREIARREDIYPPVNFGGYRDGDSRMNYPGLPWGKVYQRKLFDRIRFPVNYWYEDTIVHFLLFRAAESFVYIPEVLYDYRWYEGNFSKVQERSNTRTLEHYWIVEYMLEEGRRVGLQEDAVLYKVLLRHLGSYLFPAVAGLEPRQQHAVFALACQLVRRCRVQTGGLNFQLRELEKSFLQGDFALWTLAARGL